MYPVLFRIGSFTVTGYTALIDIGLLGGAVIACLQAQRRGLNAAWVLDAALAATLGGLIGGRAAYVVAHWAYYSDYLRRALRLWDGGLAWHGGLAGGLAALLAYCALALQGAPSRRALLRQALDALTPGAAVLAVCSWLGCLLNGCACGLETYPGQRLLWALSLELPDLYGIQAPRVAVQLLGAGWSTLVLATVVIAGRRTQSVALLFPLWLALYSTGSFGLGFLRADEVALVGGWRADQVADLVLAVTGAAVLATALFRKRRSEEI